MVNNLPGPDKGLLDALFGGSKADAAQAAMPSEGKVEDFAKLLKDAQDQKNALIKATAEEKLVTAQALPQTKGENLNIPLADNEALKKKAQTEVKPSVADAVPVQKAKDEKEKSEKTSDAAIAMAVAANTKANTTVPAPEAKLEVKTQASVKNVVDTNVKKQALPKEGLKKTDVATTLPANLAVGPTNVQQPKTDALKSGVSAIEVKPQQQSVPMPAKRESAHALVEMSNAGISDGPVLNPQQAPMVLQPIIMPIQMPVAFPVVVEEASVKEVTPGFNPGVNSFESKKDSSLFSDQGKILGVNHPDPRLVGNPIREKQKNSQDSADQFKDNQGTALSQMQLLMPQVPSHRSEFGVVMNPSTAGSAAQVDVANPMDLATHVRNLAGVGGGSIRMKVMPENLGEVTISVNSRGGKLDVKFEASSTAAREALTESLPELRQALSGKRLQVGSLEVEHHSAHSAVATQSTIGMPQFDRLAGNDSSGMGFGQQQSQSWNQSERQNDSQGGNAWDRYFSEQDARQRNGGQRQRSGYRFYQDAELAG